MPFQQCRIDFARCVGQAFFVAFRGSIHRMDEIAAAASSSPDGARSCEPNDTTVALRTNVGAFQGLLDAGGYRAH